MLSRLIVLSCFSRHLSILRACPLCWLALVFFRSGGALRVSCPHLSQSSEITVWAESGLSVVECVRRKVQTNSSQNAVCFCI